MSEPFVSVKMKTYNQEKYIGQAIESVLAQKTDFSYELIIGEDCSTDCTREIVFQYQKKYPKVIRVVTSEKNVGLRKNALRILKSARGKYIAHCEGDDYWCDPLKLQKQVDIMEADPSISMCFHAVIYEYMDSSGKKKIKRYHKGNYFFPIKDVIIQGGRFYKLVSAIVNRSIFNTIPDWYIQSPVTDSALSLLAALNGRIYYLNEVMAVYRLNVSGSWSESVAHNTKAYEEHFLKLMRTRKMADKSTHYSYHKYFSKRISMNIMEILLTSKILKKEFQKIKNDYFQYISPFSRIVVFFLHSIHAYWFWSLMRMIKNRLYKRLIFHNSDHNN